MTTEQIELFPPKTDKRVRIYAWSPVNPPPGYEGQIKIGQTIHEDVNARIKQSQGQMRQEYVVHFSEIAERNDGTEFTDSDIHRILLENGHERVDHGGSREWFRCTPEEAKSALLAVRNNESILSTHHQTFPMRAEQEHAVELTLDHFRRVWAESPETPPRFLWNAKMRFGKTFTAYQLAKRMGAMRTLVLTFKPAVADAWRTDLRSHRDFYGWQYRDRDTGFDTKDYEQGRPLVYFGSFQDLMGREPKTGNIKPHNEWIHEINWDLVIFDEYHYGAWREKAKELFEGEEKQEARNEVNQEFGTLNSTFETHLEEYNDLESDFLPITSKAYLYLSGTPFRALKNAEFVDDQIFNWTYTDEQRAKRRFSELNPDKSNPYGALPEMRLFTYKMPSQLVSIARQGDLDEFDLNEFFSAYGTGHAAQFKHKSEVQKWLDLIRGGNHIFDIDVRAAGGGNPPLPFSDVRLRPYLNHSFWYLPNVAACYAMSNLLSEPQNQFFHDYKVLVVAGKEAGVGAEALPPVRHAIQNHAKTITLSCGKLTTGVTVKQWSSILMLRNLTSPESYFQAAFRVQSPWSIKNPEGTDPDHEHVVKEACFVFDFAPNRALRQLAEYGTQLAPAQENPDHAVQELVNFLPVLAYDGMKMLPLDAESILQYAMSGTTGSLLASKWESRLLVQADNDTLRRLLNNEKALEAILKIEGFRSLGKDAIETVINKSESIKAKRKPGKKKLDDKEAEELSEEEKETRRLRDEIKDKLVQFIIRIPAFMYLTDFRENTLQDIITKLEPGLFKTVTGLNVSDFNLLVEAGVFNAPLMNEAIIAFRRFENASLSYTGLDPHKDRKLVGAFDTAVAIDAITE